MAYIKTVFTKITDKNSNKVKSDGGIKNNSYMYSALEYILNPEKVNEVYFTNCTQGDIYEIVSQFEMIRICYQKNDKILGHHLVQSFDPEDNVTPTQAYEIGKKLIDKIAPGYQVVMATHIDTGIIHNHFVINSVNIKSGKKYLCNKSSLAFAREESDKLCKQYQLSVIDKNSKNKFKGIDQTTYQLGVKGKSWKINLLTDLDEAFQKCKSKDEFINFMERKDYNVKYKDIHITFQKNGEKKGIRADTLAKQFGDKYSKANIDRLMNVVPNQEVIAEYEARKKKRQTKETNYKSEYQRLEDDYFKYNSVSHFNINDSWMLSKDLFKQNPFKFTLQLIKKLFLKNHKAINKAKKQKQPYKVQRQISNKEIYACKGNISYKDIKSAPGETAQIKVYAWQLPKLLSQQFFYTSFINIKTGVATVTLKSKDLTKMAKAFELSDEQFFVKQSEIILNKKTYRKLKAENEKLSYLMVTREQKQLIKDNYIEFAFFDKTDNADNKINIAFAPSDKKRILNLLYPEKVVKSQTTKKKLNNMSVEVSSKPETAFQRNGRINHELKEIAAKTNDKLIYKVVSSTQLFLLNNQSDMKFASFNNGNGKNNIVFLSSDKNKIDTVLYGSAKNLKNL